MDFSIRFLLDAVAPPSARISAIHAQIQNQLKGVKAQVDVGINPNQISQLNSANVALSQTRANLDAVSSSAKGSASSMRDLNRVMVDSSGFIENISTQAGLAARRFAAFTLAAGSMMELARGIRETVVQAIEFQRTMNVIAQISSESAREVSGLAAEITKLSTSLGVPSADLVKMTEQLKQTGLSVREVKEAMASLAQASLGPSFGDMVSTTQGAIAMLRQFGLETKDLGGALGSINAVASQFAVEAKDIVEAVTKAGGSFRAAGGDLTQFIGLFTSIRATTRESAQEIGTAMRTIFSRLERGDTVERLKDLGINLRYTASEAENLGRVDLQGQFVGASEAVARLSAVLKNLPTTDIRSNQIIEQLGGYRQISRVLPLIQQYDQAQRAMAVAQSGQLTLQANAEKAQETLANRLTKTKEAWLALGRSFIESSGFDSAAKSMLDMASGLAKVMEVARPLIPLLMTMAAIKIGQGIRNGAISNFAGTFTAPMGSRVSGGGGNTARGFARGGHVPGSGDTDSVHAVLTPGEYVMRKDAVKAIGVPTLEAWNQGQGHSRARRYASGGYLATLSDVQQGARELRDSSGINFASFINKLGVSQNPRGVLGAEQPVYDNKRMSSRGLHWQSKKGQQGVIINSSRGVFASHDAMVGSLAHEFGHGIDKYLSGGNGWASDNVGSEAHRYANAYATGVGLRNPELARHGKDYAKYRLAPKEAFADQFRDFVTGAHEPRGYFRRIVEPVARATNPNYQERDLGFIGNMARRPLLGMLPRMMGFAQGGEAGKDSIAAMLTPGEYVLNRHAVASIGTGNLDRLNNSGMKRFALGGPVGGGQHFAGGGPTAMTMEAVRESQNPNVAALTGTIQAAAAAAEKSLFAFSEVLIEVTKGAAKFVGFVERAATTDKQFGLKAATLTPGEQQRLIGPNRTALMTHASGNADAEDAINDSMFMAARSFDPSKHINPETKRPFTTADLEHPVLQDKFRARAYMYASGAIGKGFQKQNSGGMTEAGPRSINPNTLSLGQLGALSEGVDPNSSLDERAKYLRTQGASTVGGLTDQEGRNIHLPDKRLSLAAAKAAEEAYEHQAHRDAALSLLSPHQSGPLIASALGTHYGPDRNSMPIPHGMLNPLNPAATAGGRPGGIAGREGNSYPLAGEQASSTYDLASPAWASERTYRFDQQRHPSHPMENVPTYPFADRTVAAGTPYELAGFRPTGRVMSGRRGQLPALPTYGHHQPFDMVGSGDNPTYNWAPPGGADLTGDKVAESYKAESMFRDRQNALLRVEHGPQHVEGVLAGRVQSKLDARGGPVSYETTLETAIKTRAEFAKELLQNEKRYLAALHPAIGAIEQKRLAEENVTKALNGEARVMMGANGKVLGTAATVDASIRAGHGMNPGLSVNFPTFDRAGRGISGIGSSIGGWYGRNLGDNSRIGRAAGSFTSRMNGNMGMAAMLALPYASVLTDQYAGTAETAAYGNGTRGMLGGNQYVEGKGLGGGIQGALTGGMTGAYLGSTMGPVGTLVGGVGGAVVGGVTGVVSAMHEAENEIRQIKIGTALSAFGDSIQRLVDSLGNDAINPGVHFSTLNNLQTAQHQQAASNTSQATSWYGSFDASAFSGLQASSNRQNFANLLPTMTMTLDRSAERLGRNRENVGVDTLMRQLTTGNGGLNQAMIQQVGSLRSQSTTEIEEGLRKLIVRGQDAAGRDRQNRAGSIAETRGMNDLGRLVAAFGEAADSVATLRREASLLSDAFEGVRGPLQVETHSTGLAHIGRPDGDFIKPLNLIGAAAGPAANGLIAHGRALNQVGGVLNDVMSSTLSRNPIEGADLTTSIQQGVTRRLGYTSNNDTPEAIKQVMDVIIRNLNTMMSHDKGPSGVIEAYQNDPSKFYEHVTGNLTEAFRNGGEQILNQVRTASDGFSTGLFEITRRVTRFGEVLDRQATTQVAGLRVTNQFDADRRYQGGRALDFLSVDQLEAPQTARLSRLTGMGGGFEQDPTTIGRALRRTEADIPIAQQRFDSTFQQTGGRGEEFRSAAIALSGLRDRAENFRRALEVLSNATERTSVMMEKLSHLNEERQGRNEYGRSFLTADFDQRFEMQRAEMLTHRALRQGNLNGSVPEDNQAIFRFLDQTRNVTLQGPRGPITGGDASRMLVEHTNPAFGLTVPQQTEQQQLQTTIAERFKAADEAMKTLANSMKNENTTFFTNLTAQHAQFYQQLAQFIIPQQQLARAQTQQADLTATGGRLAGQERQANLLRGFGITSTSQVEALNERHGDLDAFLGAVQGRNRATRDRDAAATGVNSGMFGPQGIRVNNLGMMRQGDYAENITRYLTANNIDAPSQQRIMTGFQANAGGLARRGMFGESAVSGMDAANLLRGLVLREGNRDAIGQADTQVGVNSRRLQAVRGLDIGSLEGVAGNEQRRSDLNGALNTFNGQNPLEGLQGRIQENNASLAQLNTSIQGLTQQIGQAAGPAAAPAAFNPDAAAAQRAADNAWLFGPRGHATGGSVGASPIGFGSATPNANFFRASGSDTTPAILTPGEYVINAASAQSNMRLLHAINGSRGPLRLAEGGEAFISAEPVRPEETAARLRIYAAGDRFGPSASYLADDRARTVMARQQHARMIAEGPLPENVRDENARNRPDLNRRDEFFAGLGDVRTRDYYSRVSHGRELFWDEQRDMAAGRARFMLDQAGQAHTLQMRVAAAHSRGRGRADIGAQMGLVGENLGAAQGLRSNSKTGNGVDYNYRKFLGRISPDQPPGSVRFAHGGIVGGSSAAGDVHPALLTGGEAVLNTRATALLGAQNVLKLNSGGIVGPTSPVGLQVRATGGSSTPAGDNTELTAALRAFSGSTSSFGEACGAFGESTKAYASAVTIFAGSSNTLADAINKMPKTIEMKGTHTLEVNMNGATVLAQLEPQLRQMVLDAIQKQVPSILKESLPDAGLLV